MAQNRARPRHPARATPHPRPRAPMGGAIPAAQTGRPHRKRYRRRHGCPRLSAAPRRHPLAHRRRHPARC
ncbi:hypothetical protein DB346_13150 [Verrucomicrobia bacterium LW23]|nr:hypothetical protein DB346_13150 [Verrucomicrobia bacterium LW23]